VASVDIPRDVAISDNVSPIITFISVIIADLINIHNSGYLTIQIYSGLEKIL
jgi:hypothetical protein